MGAESAVGGLEMEHRLSGLLGHRHEAPVVLQQAQTVRVVVDPPACVDRALDDLGRIGFRDPRHPAVVGAHRPIQPDGVLQDHVADRLDSPFRQLQLWVRIPLPSDFAAMAATPTLSLDTYTSDTTNGTVLVTVYDTDNSADCTSAAFTPTATTTWQSKTATTCLDTGTYAANGTITIDIKITAAATTGDTRISDIYFDYLSKW